MEAQSGASNRKENEARRAQEKKAAELAKKEAAQLFNPVLVPQKVPFGVDPKSILCIYFKQGICTKGNKCKFSHNLTVERKTVKKDLYTDDRQEKEKDTMDNWDEEKLRQVVMSKYGNPKTTTDIVCKYFIEAVENMKYGWFWQCPNGDDCKYRHSLPPGFVLKTKEQKKLEKMALAEQPKITLEDFIETERHKLPKKLTPVTWETFSSWKKDREERKQKEAGSSKKKERILSGKQLLQTGKYKDVLLDDESDHEGEEEVAEEDHGEEMDLSQFTKSLRLEDNDEKDIIDYGDGQHRFDVH